MLLVFHEVETLIKIVIILLLLIITIVLTRYRPVPTLTKCTSSPAFTYKFLDMRAITLKQFITKNFLMLLTGIT